MEKETLGNLVAIVGGGTPSREISEYYVGHIPWATVKDFKCDYIADTEEHITQAAVDASSTNVIPPCLTSAPMEHS